MAVLAPQHNTSDASIQPMHVQPVTNMDNDGNHGPVVPLLVKSIILIYIYNILDIIKALILVVLSHSA